jgi:hypothetical protein
MHSFHALGTATKRLNQKLYKDRRLRNETMN